MNRLHIISFMLLLLFFVSCNNKSKENHHTDNQSFAEELPLPMSYIEAPIAFRADQIEEKINKAIKGSIYEDHSFERGKEGLKIRVKKAGRLQLEAKNNYLYFSIPLSIWVSKRLIKAKLFKRRFETSKEVDFSLIVQFRSKVDIDNNWRFRTETKYIGVKWKKKPKVKLMGVKFNLAGLLESQLLQKKSKIEQKIDESTPKLKVIKKQVKKIWTKLQTPIKLEKKVMKYLWLVTKPQNVSLGNIRAHNGQITASVRLENSLYSVVGDTPKVAIKPLPRVKPYTKKITDKFELHVKGLLPYAAINKLIASKIQDTTIQIPQTDYSLQIKDATLFGRGNKLVVSVDIKGDFEGQISMSGTPRFDSLTKTLHFDDFDYELDTEESLVSTANWLLESTAKEELQKVMMLPLDNYIQKLPALIQKGLTKGKLGKKALFNLENFELYPRFIQVDKDELRVYVKATGNVGVDIVKI